MTIFPDIYARVNSSRLKVNICSKLACGILLFILYYSVNVSKHVQKQNNSKLLNNQLMLLSSSFKSIQTATCQIMHLCYKQYINIVFWSTNSKKCTFLPPSQAYMFFQVYYSRALRNQKTLFIICWAVIDTHYLKVTLDCYFLLSGNEILLKHQVKL